jgi:hypothetical protein
MDRPFVAENARQRQRLLSLVSRLTDQELCLRLSSGLTIAATLAHLAFWDQRALILLRRWKQFGVGPSPIDIDATNDALAPFLTALLPQTAADLALSIAEEIDRELEQAPDRLIQDIYGLEGKFKLRRSEHRREHLDEIEAFLQERKSSKL